ncbi:MAG: TonB-dependent receptor [Bacteroidota bacterium]|nr:TonB-dependent receptor [Bacteroidota bacterium]
MKLGVFNIYLFVCMNLIAQNNFQGILKSIDGETIPFVEIFSENKYITSSDLNGIFNIVSTKNEIEIYFFIDGFLHTKKIILNQEDVLEIIIEKKSVNLNEVEIIANKRKSFVTRKLNDVEGITINAGKKNEVILVDQSIGNIASNNSRQIYSQVPGLNIFENDDAGIQLNIGGRGLNPNRSSNFNTRQNGYDISADVLGYPESYYTPPAESLQEIQIIRGAASLQYGTQFGGLVNFIFKEPIKEKPLEILTRNSIGSFNLFTNFTSLSGTNKKLSYYTFFNFKEGKGFRPNSNFNSKNIFFNINYNINKNSKLKFDITYLKYLSKQAGGLSDKMFLENPFQSNRERNWFGLDWLIYNLSFSHKINSNTNLNISLFGLNAKRNSLGFRTNRVDQIDPINERDLINGDFNNFGGEIRLLSNYKFFNYKSPFLIGLKIYNSNNKSQQGPGSGGYDANFAIKESLYPNYTNQSSYKYPNSNIAFFGENIFYISESFSITPGFRYEFIKTASEGYYKKINLDGAGNVILNNTIDNSENRTRNFILYGIGLSFKPNKLFEFYSNFSENYRSVTFADISILNPAFSIDPNITDEKGSTFDFGVRGNFKNYVSFDTNYFILNYNNRIGFVPKLTSQGNVKSQKGNVGNAKIQGIESLIDFNLKQILGLGDNYIINTFLNFSQINSKYINSDIPGIEGKQVEFVPKNNVKIGFRGGYKNFIFSYQYTYMSNQYTDASNAIIGSLSGVIGQIPSYKISDLSFSYNIKKTKIEVGFNNIFNEKYFTRRATGYPGPGIIPSSPRSIYLTFEYKI